ncbi:MAG TPA: metal-dependent hydrolase [Spirochaetia bacterium]|nr:metal-dependent hydrolase [Spirochaetia bacterium]
MALNITFLGHSGFQFDDGTHQLVIDPFLTGNPVATQKAADLSCQYIALSHGHSDHFGDTLEIAKKNDATVIASFEICSYVASKGIQKIEPANPGGRVKTDFGWVALTQAFHSSSLDGQYMGLACGLVVRIGGITIYHTGDTALFSDMKLIGEMYKPDVAMIPCGDRFTMGVEAATMAAEFIRPKYAVPIHYGTFGLIAPTSEGFSPKGVQVREMKPGSSWKYSG